MKMAAGLAEAVQERGGALYAAAEALVPGTSREFTLDTLSALSDELEAGTSSLDEAVKRAFAVTADRCYPMPPAARRARAEGMLDNVRLLPPEWLVAEVAGRPAVNTSSVWHLATGNHHVVE